MKKYLFAIIAFCFVSLSNAQTSDSLGFSKAGITICTGINNSYGIFGAGLFFSPYTDVVLDAGLGISSWGIKSSFNVQYYPTPNKQTYFKAGISHSGGGYNIPIELESTSLEKVEYKIDFKPLNNLNICIGKSWSFNQKHRFYIEGGYSKLFADRATVYSVVSKPAGANDMSEMSKKGLEFTAPGGLILALGFSVGIN